VVMVMPVQEVDSIVRLDNEGQYSVLGILIERIHMWHHLRMNDALTTLRHEEVEGLLRYLRRRRCMGRTFRPLPGWFGNECQ